MLTCKNIISFKATSIQLWQNKDFYKVSSTALKFPSKTQTTSLPTNTFPPFFFFHFFLSLFFTFTSLTRPCVFKLVLLPPTLMLFHRRRRCKKIYRNRKRILDRECAGEGGRKKEGKKLDKSQSHSKDHERKLE